MKEITELHRHFGINRFYDHRLDRTRVGCVLPDVGRANTDLRGERPPFEDPTSETQQKPLHRQSPASITSCSGCSGRNETPECHADDSAHGGQDGSLMTVYLPRLLRAATGQ